MALSDNIVNYYKMENTNDELGSNNLTNTGMTNGAAKIGNGYSNNGSNGVYLSRSGIASGIQTISFWYYHTGTVNKYFFKQSNGWEFYISNDGTIILGDNAGTHYMRSTTALSNGNWYHIVAVTGGTTATADNKIYINGVSETLSTNTYAVADLEVGSGTLYIGNYSNGNLGINGKLDEIGLWSRTLTSTEVTALYNSGNGFQYPFAVAPVAAFSGTPLSNYLSVTTVFTDASTNTPTAWSWKKNDGTGYTEFSTNQNPTETFSNIGTYDIKLTVTNAVGSDDEEKLDYVTVNPPVPIIIKPMSGTKHKFSNSWKFMNRWKFKFF